MKRYILFIILFSFLFQSVFASDLEKMIGQMIVIGFDGNSTRSKAFKRILTYLERGEIGGVILFSKNIKDKNTLIKMNEKILKSNPITPLIAIDNEGGKIQRHDFAASKSAFEVSFLTKSEAKKEYQDMAQLLQELKINVNFAPCVDLAINKESIIAKKQRSYGDDPEIITKYASIFINEHAKQGIITSIKHFPGHGSVQGDTHKGFVDATETFNEKELIPYKNLIGKDELNTVMVSHIYNKNFDENFPASLSKKTIKDYLIKELGYQGVIFSDDYDMKAIRANYTLDEIITYSINSGVNIILFSNNLEYKDRKLPEKIRKIVLDGVLKGTINPKDINNSYQKIVKLKSSLH